MGGFLDLDQPGFDGQLKMAEGVDQPGQFLMLAQRQRVLVGEVIQVLQVVQLRQAPQAAPQARRRATVKQDGALGIGQHRHQRALLWDGLARLGDRVAGFQAQHVGFAAFFQRAQQAAGFAAGAQGGAHVHHGLGVGVDALKGREALCGGPQLLSHLGFARVALLCSKARQHAFDVAVEDRCTQAHAQARNRASGGQADTRQFGEFFHVAGEFAAVFGHHDLRGLLQVARPGVVAQARPQVQHFIFRRGGQGFDRRQGGHEPVEVVEHGADLGLLQHDLRHPHPVRRDALLPGQVVAAMAVVPVQHRL